MTKRTPKLGLTVPDLNDYIAEWPQIAEQGFRDVEDSVLIEAKNATDPYDSYPIGMSMFGLTGTTASDLGWPESSGMVISWKRLDRRQLFQLKVTLGITRGPIVYARTGSEYDPGWSPWAIAASRNLPTAVAIGSVTASAAQDETVELTVAFPTDTFTAPPNVTLTPQAVNPDSWAYALSTDPTAEQCVFRVKRLSSGSGSVRVRWQATQPGV